MGDVAKGIKSFKKGMSDVPVDTSSEPTQEESARKDVDTSSEPTQEESSSKDRDSELK